MKKEVFNNAGKVVGFILNGALCKKVKRSKHYHRILNSWGVDKSILAEDFEIVKILETESDQLYVAPKSLWLEKGIRKNFGYGEQVFLPLHHFEVRSRKQLSLV